MRFAAFYGTYLNILLVPSFIPSACSAECLYTMVFFNDKKFACESCIKGHRSSACHHTDRPLFEIKKKGRPVSQCPKCRELRQSKKLHSKCTCDHKDDAPLMQPLSSSSTSKPRFIPIIPALPNGLKDAIAASQSSTAPPDSRQRVDSLLNPCNCTDVWKCRCRVSQSANSSAPNVQISDPLGGLATLARAAVMQKSSPDAHSRPSSSAIDPGLHSRPATPANIAFRKRQKKTHEYFGLYSRTGSSSHTIVSNLAFSAFNS